MFDKNTLIKYIERGDLIGFKSMIENKDFAINQKLGEFHLMNHLVCVDKLNLQMMEAVLKKGYKISNEKFSSFFVLCKNQSVKLEHIQLLIKYKGKINKKK